MAATPSRGPNGRALTPEDEERIAASLPDEDEGIEDDEGEGDEGDDEGDEALEDEVAAAPEPPRRGPGRPPKPRPMLDSAVAAMAPRPPPAPRASRAQPQETAPDGAAFSAKSIQQVEQQAAADELQEVLSGLDFASSQVAVSVFRTGPEVDVETGERIQCGYLGEFKRPITVEDLRKQYGGGIFNVRVRGPRVSANGKRFVGLIRNLTYNIVGAPIQVTDPRRAQVQAKNDQAKAENANLAMVQEAIGTQKQMMDRVYDENKELKSLLLTRMASPETSPFKDIIPLLVNGPDKIREELKEERRLQLEQARADREERAREREADQRRFEAKMESDRQRYESERAEQKQRHEKEMEQTRMEMRAMREEGKGAVETQMMLMQKMESDKEARAQTQQQFMMNMMQESNKQTLLQLQQMETMKTQFLTEMIKDARSQKPDDMSSMMEKVLQLKQVVGVLTGQEEKDTWEKVFDRVSDVVPGIAAAAKAFTSQPAAPSAAAQAGPRFAPGSVAVVDVPSPPRQLPPKRKRGPAFVAKPTEAPLAASLSQAAKPTPPPAEPPPPPLFPTNPMTGIIIPSPGSDLEEAVRLLVQDIDYAIQKDYTPERIFIEIVAKFPPEVLALLKSADVETCVNVVSQQAPDTWIIATPKGAQVVAAVHALLTAK